MTNTPVPSAQVVWPTGEVGAVADTTVTMDRLRARQRTLLGHAGFTLLSMLGISGGGACGACRPNLDPENALGRWRRS
jgi:hypothetical protein